MTQVHDLETAAAPADHPTSTRLMSLDALRGFDMFWIVGGSIVVQRLAKASGHPCLLLYLYRNKTFIRA